VIFFDTPVRDPEFRPTELIDRASGVMVAQPGRAWTIAGGLGAVSVGGEGAAGAGGGGVRLEEAQEQCTGLVRVAAAGEGDPKATGERLLAAWCGGACDVHAQEFVLYNGKTAWRFEGARRLADGTTEMVRTSVLVNPGARKSRWQVVVEARGHGRDYAARRRCLDAITAAVSVGLADGVPEGFGAEAAAGSDAADAVGSGGAEDAEAGGGGDAIGPGVGPSPGP
jgi:hypothetical protein